MRGVRASVVEEAAVYVTDRSVLVRRSRRAVRSPSPGMMDHAQTHTALDEYIMTLTARPSGTPSIYADQSLENTTTAVFFFWREGKQKKQEDFKTREKSVLNVYSVRRVFYFFLHIFLYFNGRYLVMARGLA